MRIKSLAVALAASSILFSSPALASASSLSVASLSRVAAADEGEGSNIMDSGFIGVAIVFGAGAAVGALLYSVFSGDDDDEPASP
jgi:hypothetical protein